MPDATFESVEYSRFAGIRRSEQRRWGGPLTSMGRIASSDRNINGQQFMALRGHPQFKFVEDVLF
jgi:hypothetical protein